MILVAEKSRLHVCIVGCNGAHCPGRLNIPDHQGAFMSLILQCVMRVIMREAAGMPFHRVRCTTEQLFLLFGVMAAEANFRARPFLAET
jgi:hypothetical protein